MKEYDPVRDGFESYGLAIRALRLEHVAKGHAEPLDATERLVAGTGMTAGEIIRMGYLDTAK